MSAVFEPPGQPGWPCDHVLFARLCATAGRLRRDRVRRRVCVGRGTEDLGDHPEVAVGCEVGDPVTAKRAAQDKLVPSFRLRGDRLVKVRWSERDVMDTLALLREEACVHALVVERLD